MSNSAPIELRGGDLAAETRRDDKKADTLKPQRGSVSKPGPRIFPPAESIELMLFIAALLDILGNCFKKLNPYHDSLMDQPLNHIYAAVTMTIISRPSIPLMMLCCGYRYVHDYKEPSVSFYYRTFRAVVVPVLIWGTLLSFGKLFYQVSNPSFHVNVWSVWTAFHDNLFTSTLPANMFFFWALTSLLLITPLIHLFMREGHIGVVLLSLVLWFLSDPLQNTLSRNWGTLSPFIFQIQGFRGMWTGYYVLGALVSATGYRPGVPEYILFFIFYVGDCLILILRTCVLTFQAENGMQQTWILETGAPVVIMSIPLFFLLKFFVDRKFMRRPFFAYLAEHSLGMTLTHGVFVDLLVERFGLVSTIPRAFLLSTALSFVLTLLFRQLLPWAFAYRMDEEVLPKSIQRSRSDLPTPDSYFHLEVND